MGQPFLYITVINHKKKNPCKSRGLPLNMRLLLKMLGKKAHHTFVHLYLRGQNHGLHYT